MHPRFENNMTQTIYQYLMDQVRSCTMKPGDRIPEQKIAQEFGISRTPVREALRQLANDGIVAIYPKRFAEVAQYDEVKLKNIGLVRIALDKLAVRSAIYFGSIADFEALYIFAQKCYEAGKAGDVSRRIQYDTQFHWELAKISKNTQLIEFQHRILINIEFLQACRYVQAEDVDAQYDTHCQLIKALMAHDEATAIRLLVESDKNFHGLEGMPQSFYY